MSSVRKVTWPVACGVEDGAVELLLRAGPGKARGQHELQFGAEEADRLRPGFRQMRHVDEEPGVHVQADRDAVEADCRRVAKSAILRLAPGAHARLFGISRLDVRRRAQIDLARVAVDDDRVALLDDFGDIRDVAHGGNGERAGDDGDMARGARLLEHETAQPRRGRNRAAPPGSSSARQGWRFPAARPASRTRLWPAS